MRSCYNNKVMTYHLKSVAETIQLGAAIGRRLEGGECIELVGDVGAGKTTFVKGIGQALAVMDDVQSPSFTINRVYEARDGLRLIHYDFYRLDDAGIMAYELAESLNDPQTIVVVEWAETIGAVLPEESVRCQFVFSEEGRQVTISGHLGEGLL